MPITDWDDAYQNMAYIPGAAAIVEDWARAAAAFRAAHPPRRIAHGPGPRQHLDLYLPDGAPEGLTVIVHGGYWHKFDGAGFAHLAAGARAAGQAVAVPTYTLAPEARIAAIGAEMARAVALAAAAVPEGAIRLAGHSAGGQVVTRLLCGDLLDAPVRARLRHVLSISGLHDLRPLRRTGMNEILHLDAAEAVTESAALAEPMPGVPVTCVVGSAERPEFRRQTDLLVNIWTGLGVDIAGHRIDGADHFRILEGLGTPDGALVRLLLGR